MTAYYREVVAVSVYFCAAFPLRNAQIDGVAGQKGSKYASGPRGRYVSGSLREVPECRNISVEGGDSMKQFLLFIGALAALAIIVASLGPLIMLAVGIWLLYLVYRQFTRAHSAGGKIGWLIIGLLVLAFITPHLPALIGVAAAYGLYLVYRSWKKEEAEPEDDPFTNFEKQWKQLQ